VDRTVGLPVDRHGKIGGEPSTAAKPATRLTGKGVDLIVRRRALLAGLSPDGDWGSHGLRAGAATAAYAAGAPVSSIATQGRWSPKSTALLSYIRAVDQWNDHP
jgi:integrase